LFFRLYHPSASPDLSLRLSPCWYSALLNGFSAPTLLLALLGDNIIWFAPSGRKTIALYTEVGVHFPTTPLSAVDVGILPFPRSYGFVRKVISVIPLFSFWCSWMFPTSLVGRRGHLDCSDLYSPVGLLPPSGKVLGCRTSSV